MTHMVTGKALQTGIPSHGAELESAAGLETTPVLRWGQVGETTRRLVPLRQAVDSAHSWLETHRNRVIS